jgi:hypothetical protein
MHKPLVLVSAALFALAACAEAPTAPEANVEPQFDVANSGNPQAAFLVRIDGRCGVYLQPGPGAVSNFDGKYYVTETSSGAVNLNCTGATLREGQIPAKTFTFAWEFSGLSCHNRITKSGTAHSNCHAKP